MHRCCYREDKFEVCLLKRIVYFVMCFGNMPDGTPGPVGEKLVPDVEISQKNKSNLTSLPHSS